MVSISSIVLGSSPAKSLSTLFAAPIRDLALLLKNPVERISCASSAWFALARSATVGYLAKRPGVTSFTRLSVHWAERIVATSNSQALRWVSAHVALGYIASRARRIFPTRAFLSAAVLGRGTRRGGAALGSAGGGSLA